MNQSPAPTVLDIFELPEYVKESAVLAATGESRGVDQVPELLKQFGFEREEGLNEWFDLYVDRELFYDLREAHDIVLAWVLLDLQSYAFLLRVQPPVQWVTEHMKVALQKHIDFSGSLVLCPAAIEHVEHYVLSRNLPKDFLIPAVKRCLES